jgi:hypothetical protein
VFDFENTAGLQTRFRPEFTLPSEPGGAPVAAPFLWRAIAGIRRLESDGDAGDPVTTSCGIICFDSPEWDELVTNLAVAVSDFGVLDGSTAIAGQGETATVTFPVRYVDGGIKGPQQLVFTATTDLPGSAATPGAATMTVAPGTSSTVSVSVPVPPATALGTYTVTLDAANGTPAVSRSNTAAIQVTDRLGPAIRIGTPGEGARFRRGDEIAADYACTDQVNGTGVGVCAGPVAPGAAIDTRSTGTKTFTVAASDRAGNATSAATHYTVLPRPAPAIKLSFTFARTATATTFTSLRLKRVPTGSTVKASCRPRRGAGCPARSFVRRNARGTVKLGRLTGRALRPGAVLDLRVTHKGSIGAVKLVRVRAGTPSVATRCVLPGSRALRKRC